VALLTTRCLAWCNSNRDMTSKERFDQWNANFRSVQSDWPKAWDDRSHPLSKWIHDQWRPYKSRRDEHKAQLLESLPGWKELEFRKASSMLLD
jgi:hypothetical protein